MNAHMDKKMHKVSVRVLEEDYQAITEYPGKNFSEKLRSLLEVHRVLVAAVEGRDLIEKYESILKEYLTEFDPQLYSEISVRRKELKRYTDTLEEIEGLQQLVDELKNGIGQFNDKSKEYLEKRVAECVMVRKKACQEE